MQTGSATTTKRCVNTRMQKITPSRSTIINWHSLFKENGNPDHRGGNGMPRTSEVRVEQVRLISENQPCWSVRAAASALQVPHTTVHRILRRCLFCTHTKYRIFMAFAAATKLNEYNLDETVKITTVDIQNTYWRLYSPMNVFIVSMVP